MKSKIVSNIVSALLERGVFVFGQFIVSFMMIKALDIRDYGTLGLIAGYYVFLNFFNVAVETILLRDHLMLKGKIEQTLYSLFIFNLFKALVLLILFLMFIPVLEVKATANGLIWGVLAFYFPVFADCLVSPFLIFATIQFKQKNVTYLSTCRVLISIVLTSLLFLFPDLRYLAFKEFLVNLIYVFMFLMFIRNELDLSFTKKWQEFSVDWSYIKKSFITYASWTHCVGVVTFFIYRSDTFFLSFFVNLESIGYYNIALSSANIANVLPQLLAYQNNLVISHMKDNYDSIRMTNIFLRVSFYLGCLTILAFLFLGKSYLHLLKGDDCPAETYFNMICIVSSLVIVKTIVSPFNSYISIKGSVRSMFWNVVLPTGIATSVLYLFSSWWAGTIGIAAANLFAAIIWLILQLREMRRYQYHTDGLIDFKEDWLFLKSMFGKKEEQTV